MVLMKTLLPFLAIGADAVSSARKKKDGGRKAAMMPVESESLMSPYLNSGLFFGYPAAMSQKRSDSLGHVLAREVNTLMGDQKWGVLSLGSAKGDVDRMLRTVFKEVLHKDIPVISSDIDPAHFTIPNPVSAHCANCDAQPEKLSGCANCKTCRYCSRECQRSHYPRHKQFCKQFQQGVLKPGGIQHFQEHIFQCDGTNPSHVQSLVDLMTTHFDVEKVVVFIGWPDEPVYVGAKHNMWLASTLQNLQGIDAIDHILLNSFLYADIGVRNGVANTFAESQKELGNYAIERADFQPFFDVDGIVKELDGARIERDVFGRARITGVTDEQMIPVLANHVKKGVISFSSHTPFDFTRMELLYGHLSPREGQTYRVRLLQQKREYFILADLNQVDLTVALEMEKSQNEGKEETLARFEAYRQSMPLPKEIVEALESAYQDKILGFFDKVFGGVQLFTLDEFKTITNPFLREQELGAYKNLHNLATQHLKITDSIASFSAKIPFMQLLPIMRKELSADEHADVGPVVDRLFKEMQAYYGLCDYVVGRYGDRYNSAQAFMSEHPFLSLESFIRATPFNAQTREYNFDLSRFA